MTDIRVCRKQLGISQAQFSEITKIPQHKLSDWELGKSEPSIEECHAITLYLEKIRSGAIETRKKKRISKTHFNSSIINQHTRRGYSRTAHNEEYLEQLKELEHKFNTKHDNAPLAMSFFAGCGGLCYGITAAGFNIVAANELVPEYKEIYKKNFPNAHFLSNDIKDIAQEEIEEILQKYQQIDLLAGGPPCQGFSLAGKRDVADHRNTLFSHYLRIADRIRPKVILMENVKLLTSMKTPDGKLVKDEIIKTFTDMGYASLFFIVNAADYGVAQNRQRVIFIGVRSDLKKTPQMAEPICGTDEGFFKKHPFFSFGDAVSDLEYLESGEQSSHDPLHRATAHPEHVLRWLYDVPQGKSAHDNADPAMRPPSGYNTTYKRQVWNEPGCTVQTTFGMISGCNNVHPIATRAMTIREAMRLQSFPDSFKMSGKTGTMHTVIGNAVPPLLAYHIASFIKENYID